MSSTTSLNIWTPWKPSDHAPWNLRRVVHLHRRVGFAANWPTIQRDLRDGPDLAIDRLLRPEVGSEYVRMSDVIGEAAVSSDSPNRLKAWWLYRMLFTPDPLTERLTLMWHNHFATSNLKVSNLELMRRQNVLFRDLGRGPFGELVSHVVKDPAMLIWLDADSNRKEHPNENLAREIMELFTLGVGNYTETDVREGARALTGWSIKEGRFRDNPRFHDPADKTLLGKTGPWSGDDMVRMLIEHPATAKRLSYRLCQLFMGEKVADDAAINELAMLLRDNELNIELAVETIVRSELFFSDRNIGNRVLSPVEYLVNAIRSLELLSPPPSTLLLAEWTTMLGQDLFYPPNVFGWPGGRAWLTTRSMIARSNLATSLVDGSIFKPIHPVEAEELMKRHGFAGSRVPEFLGQLLFGMNAESPLIKQKLELFQSSTTPSVSGLIVSLLASPNAMLG